MVQLQSKLQRHVDAIAKGLESEGVSKSSIKLDKPDMKFLCFCCQSRYLIYAVTPESGIVEITLTYNGVSITGKAKTILEFDRNFGQVTAVCVDNTSFYAASKSGVHLINLASKTVSRIYDQSNFQLVPYRLKCFKGGLVFTDSDSNGIWFLEKDIQEPVRINAIAPKCHRGVSEEMSFKSPRGLAVEFDNVLYVVDHVTESVSIITPVKNTSYFLRNLGKLYDAFSIHKKNAKYELNTIEDAIEMVKSCHQFLSENEKSIRDDVSERLPGVLNGPQGNVASKTIRSTEMVLEALERLAVIIKRYNFTLTNLLSCLTIDVEHFHSSTHAKCQLMSLAQYIRAFGATVKESLKRLCTWSVHYFTGSKHWYPKPETALKLSDIPIITPIPPRTLEKDEIEEMRNWAAMFGKAVRQRTNRQETTMEKSGTLPAYCYEDNNETLDSTTQPKSTRTSNSG